LETCFCHREEGKRFLRLVLCNGPNWLSNLFSFTPDDINAVYRMSCLKNSTQSTASKVIIITGKTALVAHSLS
jgi:hypothetical protein